MSKGKLYLVKRTILKVKDEIIKLAERQITKLKLRDIDIESGRLISQEQLNENDLDWLRIMFFTKPVPACYPKRIIWL